MTPLLSALSDICRKYPLKEKVLITPDYRLGREVLQALSRSGAPWVNFILATASSLASEVAEKIITEKKLKRVSGPGIMAIVEDVFYGLADSGKLRYFEKHETNSGIINALTGVIMELRTKGISPSAIKGEYLTNADKACDLNLIFSEYEKKLDEKKLIDKAGLTLIALESLKDLPSKKRKYIIFSRYYMSGLERKFIERLAGKDLEVIRDGPVFGISEPKGLWGKQAKGDFKDSSALAGVYDTSKDPRDPADKDLELFASRGSREEVKEIFRIMALRGISLDDAEIVYPDSGEYRREIMLYSEKLGCPVTFSEGVPALVAGPFRAVRCFLDWIKHDFWEIYLRRALASGDMKTDKGNYGRDVTELAHFLKTAGVGWSRSRYEKVLGKKEAELLKKAEEPYNDEEADNHDGYLRMAADIGMLRKICMGLLSLVPEPGDDGLVRLKDMCDGVSGFLREYTVIRSSNDSDFVEEALKRSKAIGELGIDRMSLSQAADKLLGTFFTVNVDPSEPRPGHLHVSHYKHGARSARGNVFFVGLDEMRFPGRRIEDPVLLDAERERISPALEVSSDGIRKNIYDMASALSGVRGAVTASFSMYDIREERNVFPSSLMLQLYRLKTSRPEADYEDLLGSLIKREGSLGVEHGEAPLDITEVWIKKLSHRGVLKDGIEAVKNIYPCIAEGLKAETARESAEFTEYDGNLGVTGDELDPRESDDIVLSCSKLEKASGCPFRYFIGNVLCVEKTDETEKDITAWLSAMQKGSLLHEVFETFTMEMREKREGLSVLDEKVAAERILVSTAERYREEIPPPNDMVYLAELSVMRKDLDVFLLTNRKLGTLPIHEELEFGTGRRDPVKIFLSGGKYFLLRGIIDRVDKVSGHEYHVWDYKTGSAYKYERRQYLAGGEQLQHALYASAAETILKEAGEDDFPVVTKAGYILASEKAAGSGKGAIFARDPSRKHIWREALETLLGIISLGGFMREPGNSCSFCDYSSMCAGKNEKERAERKKLSGHPAMELWRKLKDYD
jgi:hypothetical protein